MPWLPHAAVRGPLTPLMYINVHFSRTRSSFRTPPRPVITQPKSLRTSASVGLASLAQPRSGLRDFGLAPPGLGPIPSST